MPPTTGPNLGLQHSWAERESGWNTGMDANLKKADAVIQAAVLDKDLTAPPGSPTAGDRYIVAASPTGSWSGHAKDIALWDGSAWQFFTPKEGWLVWVGDEALVYIYASSAWMKYRPGDASGTHKYLYFPIAAFGYITKSWADPSSDDGAYEYASFPAAADTKMATSFCCPNDYGSTVSWKLIFGMNGIDATNMTVYMGLNEWNSGGSEFLPDLCALGAGVFTPYGSSGPRYQEGTFTTPTLTLTPGKMYKLYFHRKNAEDANGDECRVIGMLLTYATP